MDNARSREQMPPRDPFLTFSAVAIQQSLGCMTCQTEKADLLLVLHVRLPRNLPGDSHLYLRDLFVLYWRSCGWVTLDQARSSPRQDIVDLAPKYPRVECRFGGILIKS